MTRTISTLLLAVAAACGGSKPAPSAKPAPAATGDLNALCVESFTRNRTCTAEYIPALVDSRARIDKPAGIAAEVKADRAAVIAKANAEWAEDGKDENIAKHCQMMTEHMTDDAKAKAGSVKDCLAQADCAGYVGCVTPIFEQLMAAGPPAH